MKCTDIDLNFITETTAVEVIPCSTINVKDLLTRIGDKCENICYAQGFLKLFINGHSYFNNRTCGNLFYWQCDLDKSCPSQAITMLSNEDHILKNAEEHVHVFPITNENTLNISGNTNIYQKVITSEKNCEEEEETCVVSGDIACDFIESNKGNRKLCLNGYLLHHNRTQNYFQHYWSCEDKKTLKCFGYAVTVVYDGKHYLKRSRVHNHPPKNNRKIVGEIINRMRKKSKAKTASESSDLVNKELIQLPDHIQAIMPQQKSILHMIKHKRKSKKNRSGTIADCDDAIGKICEIVKSAKGNDKLIAQDYMYTFNKINTYLYHWVCDRRKTPIQCMGSAVTNFVNGQHYLKTVRKHNHKADLNRNTIARIMTKMKQTALETDETPLKIIEDTLVNLDKNILKILPRQSTIIRSLYTHRLNHVIKSKSLLDENKCMEEI